MPLIGSVSFHDDIQFRGASFGLPVNSEFRYALAANADLRRQGLSNRISSGRFSPIADLAPSDPFNVHATAILFDNSGFGEIAGGDFRGNFLMLSVPSSTGSSFSDFSIEMRFAGTDISSFNDRTRSLLLVRRRGTVELPLPMVPVVTSVLDSIFGDPLIFLGMAASLGIVGISIRRQSEPIVFMDVVPSADPDMSGSPASIGVRVHQHFEYLVAPPHQPLPFPVSVGGYVQIAFTLSESRPLRLTPTEKIVHADSSPFPIVSAARSALERIVRSDAISTINLSRFASGATTAYLLPGLPSSFFVNPNAPAFARFGNSFGGTQLILAV